MDSAYSRDINRRSFIRRLVGTLLISTSGSVLLNAIPNRGFALSNEQNWRFCQKCNALFFDGRGAKGRCPAGNGHLAAGYNFYMVVGNVGEPVPPGQLDWRCCKKCYTMYYDGYPNKNGNCPAGGGHLRENELYTLEYDRGASAGEQRDWRFCNKCYALFFDGYPNKGRCPAGSAHVAQGYNFVLKYKVQRIDE